MGLGPPPPPAAVSPRLVVYTNTNTDPILANANTLPYSHYILAFLIPDGDTAVKPSRALQEVLAQPEVIAAAQAAGKKVMVSLGGGTLGAKDWLTLGKNAAAVADSVAQIIDQYHLDGVDLDIEAVPYERQSSFQPYADAAIALTQALAARLPGKLLTHAPQPPYLCAPGSCGCPPDSLYATILNATGEQISWLNMQYYSNPPVTASDIDELASYRSIVNGWQGFAGLPAHRLVLGKPYSSKVSGYQPLAEVVSDLLNPLVAEYGDQFGGFMAWEFNEDADGSWATAIASTLGEQ